MNSFRIIQVCLSFLAVSIFTVRASELRITLKIDKHTAADIRLKIEGDFATATVDGETERFNLKEMSWLNAETSEWVSLARSKEWAEMSKAKTLKNVDSAPAHIRPFLRWSLDPTFNIGKTNDTVHLTSGQVNYVIIGEASKTNVDGYFRYAVLNAYKKAMAEKKLPPYSELKAIDEMKARGCIPRRVSIAIPGIAGSPAIEMEIAEIQP